jgi:hypothetical protein
MLSVSGILWRLQAERRVVHVGYFVCVLLELEGTPRNLYQKRLLRTVYQNGLPLLPWRASSSPAAHQRDPQRTSHLLCERDPQLLSRMVDRGHVSLGRPPALWCFNHINLCTCKNAAGNGVSGGYSRCPSHVAPPLQAFTPSFNGFASMYRPFPDFLPPSSRSLSSGEVSMCWIGFARMSIRLQEKMRERISFT